MIDGLDYTPTLIREGCIFIRTAGKFLPNKSQETFGSFFKGIRNPGFEGSGRLMANSEDFPKACTCM
jgi:hypothetical protein